ERDEGVLVDESPAEGLDILDEVVDVGNRDLEAGGDRDADRPGHVRISEALLDRQRYEEEDAIEASREEDRSAVDVVRGEVDLAAEAHVLGEPEIETEAEHAADVEALVARRGAETEVVVLERDERAEEHVEA